MQLFLSFSVVNSNSAIVFETITVFKIGVLLFFFIVLVYSILNDKVYITFIPFILLGFPSIVNDFFPSFQLGEGDERGFATFSFITHIDIFLIAGIIKKLASKKSKIPLLSGLFSTSVLMLILSGVINLFQSNDYKEILYLAQGTYQIRYIILIYLVVSLYKIENYFRNFNIGIVITIFFLLIESSVFSFVFNYDRLSSGSLGVNTFGNIVASLFCYIVIILIYRREKRDTFLMSMAALCAISIVLLSQTRMSFIIVIVSLIIFNLLIYKFKPIKLIFVVFIIVASGYLAVSKFEIYNRYNFFSLYENISLSKVDSNLVESIKVTEETSSIITRIKLYLTSYNMIIDHPMTGVGMGRWNPEKYNYGFSEKVLIDSHNGYLSFISQYGVFALPFMIFYYIQPIKKVVMNKKVGWQDWKYLSIICISLSIADVSNSSSFKHQVFAFFILIIMIIHNCFKKNNSEIKDFK